MIEPINAGDWKVRIDRPIWQHGLSFYVLRHTGGFLELLQADGKLIRIADGATSDKIKPTFVLSGLDGKQMMIALAEALETEGVKTPNDFKVQGLLEATREHLSDMRKLVFKP